MQRRILRPACIPSILSWLSWQWTSLPQSVGLHGTPHGSAEPSYLELPAETEPNPATPEGAALPPTAALPNQNTCPGTAPGGGDGMKDRPPAAAAAELANQNICPGTAPG